MPRRSRIGSRSVPSADETRGDASRGHGGVVIDRIVSTLTRELGLSAGPLGLLIGVYYGLWGELTMADSRLQAVLGNIVQFFVYAGVITIIGRAYLRWRLRRAAPWLREARSPDRAEGRAVAALPAQFARDAALTFVAMALITAAGNFRAGGFGAELLRIAAGLSLVGLMFAALVYLITERAVRPLLAQVPLEEARMRSVGVRPRMFLGWALGSGVPLLFILAIPLQGTGEDRLPVTIPMLFMACTGLIAGVITMAAVARSIADPLREIRSALAGVETGDLDSALVVDDPGEIGLLQRGFNRMVEGLRERRRIEDLFGRHVGDEVARRALETGVQFEGELRTVAVVFVDIIGSTALSESGDPRDVVELLNRFFGEVVAAVRAEGGWVNKFEGDAALCVFGAPLALPGEAAAALRASRALRTALDRLPLDAGIGVSAGEVVAGNVGAADRYEYTVIGGAVNEAARLTEHAKQLPERLVADAQVVNGAGEESINWRSAGEVQVRGLTRVITIAVPASGNP